MGGPRQHEAHRGAAPRPGPTRQAFNEAEKCPLRRGALSACPHGDPLGDIPPSRNKLFLGPCEAPNGTNTQVTSAKGHVRAYPRSFSFGGARGVWRQLVCVPNLAEIVVTQREVPRAGAGSGLRTPAEAAPDAHTARLGRPPSAG